MGVTGVEKECVHSEEWVCGTHGAGGQVLNCTGNLPIGWSEGGELVPLR